MWGRGRSARRGHWLLIFYGFFWRGACQAGRNLGKSGDSYNKMKCTHHLVRLCDVAARTRPLQPSFLLLWAAAWVVPVASPSSSRRPVCSVLCAVRQLSGVIGAERTATKSKSNYRPAAHQQVCNFFVSYFSFPSESLNWGNPDFFAHFRWIRSFGVVAFCFRIEMIIIIGIYFCGFEIVRVLSDVRTMGECARLRLKCIAVILINFALLSPAIHVARDEF